MREVLDRRRLNPEARESNMGECTINSYQHGGLVVVTVVECVVLSWSIGRLILFGLAFVVCCLLFGLPLSGANTLCRDVATDRL